MEANCVNNIVTIIISNFNYFFVMDDEDPIVHPEQKMLDIIDPVTEDTKNEESKITKIEENWESTRNH